MAVRIPELIEVPKVARAIGWPSRKMRRFLLDNGMSFQSDVGKGHLIFRDEFEAKLPKVYRIFVDKYASGLLFEGRGGTRQKGPNTAKDAKRNLPST